MRLKGLSIGIPLSLLQSLSMNLHYGANIHPSFTPVQIASNFLISSAIYDSDRMDENTTRFETRLVEANVVASLVYLSQDTWTLPMVPLLYFLKNDYSDIKPTIGPVKPFFVAFFWTVAVYYLPLLHFHDLQAFKDIITPMSLFLSLSAFSHAADINDIEEDFESRVITPAVRMGEIEAVNYAIGCVLASIVVHNLHINYAKLDAFYDVCSLVVTIFILSINNLEEQEAKKDVEIYRNLCIMFFGSGLFLEYFKNKDKIPIEIATTVLHSSEGIHKQTIDFITWTVEEIDDYPEPIKNILLNILTDCIMLGDKIGSLLLKFYLSVIR